jgi:hypothetical protein
MSFSITIEPTPEQYEVPLKSGDKVPTRIWAGHTSGGIAVEAYVFSITPDDEVDAERLHSEMPDYMQATRQKVEIGADDPLAQAHAEVRMRAIWLHLFGDEPPDDVYAFGHMLLASHD